MKRGQLADYATIIGGVCSPFALFFTAAVFFQWKPETFSNLGIVSKPVGVAIIVFLLGVLPWGVMLYSWQRPYGRQDTMGDSSRFYGRSGLVIHYAGYGIGGSQYIDVTEKLTALIVNEGLHQRITSSLFKLERPYYNQGKHLLVVYSSGKEKREKRVVHVEEEGLLELP